MNKERLVILLGTSVALVFFYLGLNKWLETKPESEPPPVVVRPPLKQPAQPPPPPEPQKPQEDQIAQKIQEEKKEEIKDKDAKKDQEDKNLTAKKQEHQKETEGIKMTQEEKVQKAKVTKQEETKAQSKKEVKEYVIQIGAFSSKENAEKVLKKAKAMGYRVEIVSEDQFYKVRVMVKTDEPKKFLAKLRSAFGGAIIKQ